MKVYRIIEYQIPDDHDSADHDWLTRTLAKSIRGVWWSNGDRRAITGTEVPSDQITPEQHELLATARERDSSAPMEIGR